MTIKTIAHAQSNIGRVRHSNQDSGYSGYQLHFVADGMGGHAGGDIASAMVSQKVAPVDAVFPNPDAAAAAIKAALLEANRSLSQTVKSHHELAGLGTTFSGIMVNGDDVTIAHIGDSRVYLCREGVTTQITKDHTFVQRLVDLGRITPEEALVHPRRSVLMRVLGDVEDEPDIDTFHLKTQPGDRWLLCSDGLCGYVPEGLIGMILSGPIPAEEAADLLVQETLEYGAPDNVTVVVVDVVPSTAATDFVPQATYVGSAANEIIIDERRGSKLLRLFNPRALTDLLGASQETSEFKPESDEYLDYILSQTRVKIKWHRRRQAATWAGLVLIGAILLGAGYAYTQTRFYVGQRNGQVAIFQGIRESLGPLKFGHLYRLTDVPLESLPSYQRSLVLQTIPATSLTDAEREIKALL
ncbi:MAG: serine/threonine-protein phosphatase, partial [Actinomycetales bacterium]|nr:serine/threonine-protein phosphatase [Actinomycetales bacterium]